MTIYNSILDTIGNTPIIRLNRLAPSHVTVYVKVGIVQPRRLGQGPAGAGASSSTPNAAACSSPATR